MLVFIGINKNRQRIEVLSLTGGKFGDAGQRVDHSHRIFVCDAICDCQRGINSHQFRDGS